MRARKVDVNHTEIADAFEALGCRVWRVNQECDLVCQLGRISVLVEVRKPGPAKPRKGRQARFHEKYRVEFVQSVDDALALVKRLRLAWAACADQFREAA